MVDGDPIGIHGYFDVCPTISVLLDPRADFWSNNVVEDMSSARYDGGAEKGFSPFEAPLVLASSLDRQGAACRDVEVLIDLCQMGRSPPMAPWAPDPPWIP